MRFVFDPQKSASNQAKHGIDFIAAQALWTDPHRLQIPARTVRGEPRDAVIGRIGPSIWTAVVTARGQETIRIICCRRAHPREARLYRDDPGL
jgi:uncharacterized DUF497 family protein